MNRFLSRGKLRSYACIVTSSILLLGLVFVGTGVAQEGSVPPSEEDSDDEENHDGVIESIEDLVEEFQDFAGNFKNNLVDAITTALIQPFQNLSQESVEVVADLLMTTPSVDSNPAVQDVHGDVLIVTYLLGGLAFMAAGILYMIGPVLSVSYQEVRLILPKLVVALVFASVSLPLLELAVDFINALTGAFAPSQPNLSFQEIVGLGTGIAIVAVIQASLLLIVVVLFILRAVYIIFVAAISPVLALMWSLPKTSKYAESFIGGWFAALMIAPLDMLVLKLSLALMRGSATGGLEGVANWMFGIAALTLLVLIPKQVWGTSQAAVGQVSTFVKGASKRYRDAKKLRESSDVEGQQVRLRDTARPPRYQSPTPPQLNRRPRAGHHRSSRVPLRSRGRQ